MSPFPQAALVLTLAYERGRQDAGWRREIEKYAFMSSGRLLWGCFDGC